MDVNKTAPKDSRTDNDKEKALEFGRGVIAQRRRVLRIKKGWSGESGEAASVRLRKSGE